MGLEVPLFGVTFRNPVLLAAGTCGFGREVAAVTRLEALGGLVTKSVTLLPRAGNPPPRVTEFDAGMLNSVGLANPGAAMVRTERLPWIDAHLPALHVFVSVAGHTTEEYLEVVRILEDGPGFVGFELNLSCPNDSERGRLPFALDPEALGRIVAGVRVLTPRPLLVKLAPNTPDFGPVVCAAEEAGADGLTLVNTAPGLILDPCSGRPCLGAGPGGVSGPALRPLGLSALRTVRALTELPLIGVGGIGRGQDAASYLELGASLVQVGTASFSDPRAAERVVRELRSRARPARGARMGLPAKGGGDVVQAYPGSAVRG